MLLRDRKPRHAKPSKTAPVLAVGGMTATIGATMAAPAEAAPPNDFAQLRMCESGGNYAINTGNGFYGAYQFDLQTWHGLGYSGRPSDASPATQDAAAERLESERGWSPWPACSRKLGLGRNDVNRASRSRTVTIAKATRPVVTAAAAPQFTRPLTIKLVHVEQGDVKAWQARMAKRGWDITVDGKYGPRSAHVAARFAAEKGIKTIPGVVDRKLWIASWESPVT